MNTEIERKRRKREDGSDKTTWKFGRGVWKIVRTDSIRRVAESKTMH